jgi:hypothetical protein
VPWPYEVSDSVRRLVSEHVRQLDRSPPLHVAQVLWQATIRVVMRTLAFCLFVIIEVSVLAET